jgi:hypothetical protein
MPNPTSGVPIPTRHKIFAETKPYAEDWNPSLQINPVPTTGPVQNPADTNLHFISKSGRWIPKSVQNAADGTCPIFGRYMPEIVHSYAGDWNNICRKLEARLSERASSSSNGKSEIIAFFEKSMYTSINRN